MISMPASTIRIRSRFDDWWVSKTEIIRPKRPSGMITTAMTARAGAKTSHRGRRRMSKTSTAAPHPIQTLRVRVRRSANVVSSVTPRSTQFQRSCSQGTMAKRETASSRPESAPVESEDGADQRPQDAELRREHPALEEEVAEVPEDGEDDGVGNRVREAEQLAQARHGPGSRSVERLVDQHDRNVADDRID